MTIEATNSGPDDIREEAPPRVTRSPSGHYMPLKSPSGRRGVGGLVRFALAQRYHSASGPAAPKPTSMAADRCCQNTTFPFDHAGGRSAASGRILQFVHYLVERKNPGRGSELLLTQPRRLPYCSDWC
jgi:hypothetical protein